MKTKKILLPVLLTAVIICCGLTFKKKIFTFTETPAGVELTENGKKVFFYQKTPKLSPGKAYFNNYLHPVYNLKGDVFTEEFPADHYHHRGIFWAWHQIYVGETNLGDGWMMENIEQEVTQVKTKAGKRSARIDATVIWKSPRWKDGTTPFIQEETAVIVYPREEKIRKIDFEIVLKPLVEGVRLGGSDDEKGYGGFCVRVPLPESTVFTSEEGPVKPQNLQLTAGRWMDISAFHDSSGEKSGVAILCHPSVPNFPAPWILRQRASMQNIVYPGREPVNLDKAVVLKYRLILHTGDASAIDLPALQSEYEKQSIE